MNIIDLSQPIYDGMPVYPGDPEVKITSVFTVANDEWAVSGIQMVTHDATHINVPRHIDKNGKTLSDYELSDRFDFDLEAERFLLEQGVISYEKLANCDELPKDRTFKFYGIPLNIKDADG